MEIKKLEVFKVESTNDGATYELTCIDRDNNEMVKPRLSKGRYNKETQKFELNDKKAEFVTAFAKETLGLDFDKLDKLVGQTIDVYIYEGFASLYEVNLAPKKDEIPANLFGKIKTGVIKQARETDKGYEIYLDYEGLTFGKNYYWSTFDPSLKMWFVDPTKKPKVIKKFEDIFGNDIEALEGKEFMFEVKKAFGDTLYIDIKGE